MLGKIVGAMVGERVSRHVSSVSGVGGALLGAGATSVIRRLGPVGLIAAGIGAYALKRHQEKLKAQEALVPRDVQPPKPPRRRKKA